MKTTLDPRLGGVLQLIAAPRHADIGSDHAQLPLALVASGRCQTVVAVELNAGPLAVARQAVREARLEGRVSVRQGDGFAPLQPGEVDSASITGMGARTILGILERAAWLPSALVLQPNAEAALLRRWAYERGYWLSDERLLPGFWNYAALRLERAPDLHPDPAYEGLPLEAALHCGPWLLRRRDTLLLAELQRQQTRLRGLLPHARPQILAEWEKVQAALAYLEQAEGIDPTRPT